MNLKRYIDAAVRREVRRYVIDSPQQGLINIIDKVVVSLNNARNDNISKNELKSIDRASKFFQKSKDLLNRNGMSSFRKTYANIDMGIECIQDGEPYNSDSQNFKNASSNAFWLLQAIKSLSNRYW